MHIKKWPKEKGINFLNSKLFYIARIKKIFNNFQKKRETE